MSKAPVIRTFLARNLMLAASLALSGCGWVVMDPSGHIAREEAQLVVTSTFLMLIIIVPVIVFTLLFAWRYRASNRSAPYEPDWDHSTKLELVIWGAPLLIVIALGAITWISTHQLDPYRPLDKLDNNRPVLSSVEPLEVQVVALDWKWLFIYPEYGIATVNQLAAPVDRPIEFSITSSTVMNSFYIPALAGQIYAMPTMHTKLHAVINEPGVYDGFSANFSGDGFSHMRFKFHGLDDAAFGEWVAQVRRAQGPLDRATYQKLALPSIREPVRHFPSVDPQLFGRIVNRCVDPRQACMSHAMPDDLLEQQRASGNRGHAGHATGSNAASAPAR